jgi:hypothetical protein
MKRIIALIIITTMTLGILTSCDVVDELLNKFGGEINGGTGDEGGDENERYTITAEEWDALDSVMNYTVDSIIVGNPGENDLETIHLIYRSTATMGYEKSTYRMNGVLYLYEYYFFTEGEQPYVVTKRDDGYWYSAQTTWRPKSLMSQITFDYQTATDFNDLFFNEERKAYTYTVVEGDYSGVVSYYFKDGNLISVDAEIMNIAGEVPYMDETIHREIDFIDFTIITIPEHKVFEG